MAALLRYLAYGSNMDTRRLRYRVPSCRFLTVARLPGYQLRFHKLSKDGSSKCDAFQTSVVTDNLWGVVFELATAEKAYLDRLEGLGFGYHDRQVTVVLPNGSSLEAATYVADPRDVRTGVAPYTWYMDFVAGGAREHALPADYVEKYIGAICAVVDPQPERERERRAEVSG